MQEALRVLEEFGRVEDPELAAEAAAIRYALYDLEVELLRAGSSGADRRRLLEACRLYLVTSPSPRLEAVVEAALLGGVRLVQYRAKEGSLAASRWVWITSARRQRRAQSPFLPSVASSLGIWRPFRPPVQIVSRWCGPSPRRPTRRRRVGRCWICWSPAAGMLN